MKHFRRAAFLSLSALVILVTPGIGGAADDPLPSWTDGPVKTNIISFVDNVTMEDGAGFVRPAGSPPSTTTAHSGRSNRSIFNSSSRSTA